MSKTAGGKHADKKPETEKGVSARSTKWMKKLRKVKSPLGT